MSDIPRLRRRILEVAHKAKEGHCPSSLSVLDIIYVLYEHVMGEDDIFLLSKGHAALGWYAVLEHRGIINSEWLDHFCEPGAALQGHPENHIPGVLFSSGSLGHGICGAVGLAYAKKVKGAPGHVYCLIGDGEAQEGSVWEAMRLIDELDLQNISIIVDMNEPERAKHALRLSSFTGVHWRSEGHDHRTLKTAFGVKHRLFFFNTTKGNGIQEMMDDPKAWHHRTAGLADILERM